MEEMKHEGRETFVLLSIIMIAAFIIVALIYIIVHLATPWNIVAILVLAGVFMLILYKLLGKSTKTSEK